MLLGGQCVKAKAMSSCRVARSWYPSDWPSWLHTAQLSGYPENLTKRKKKDERESNLQKGKKNVNIGEGYDGVLTRSCSIKAKLQSSMPQCKQGMRIQPEMKDLTDSLST